MKTIIKGFTVTQSNEFDCNVFQDFGTGLTYDRALTGTAAQCVFIAMLELLCEEGGNGREDLHYVLLEHDDHPTFRLWLQEVMYAPSWKGAHVLDIIESGVKMSKDVLAEQKVRECFTALRG